MAVGPWLRLKIDRARDGVSGWLSPWPVGVVRVAIALGAVMLAACAVERGIAARRWAWDFTDPFRYSTDINRGFTYGKRALTQGYIDLYARREAETRSEAERRGREHKNDLNYAPLRLATMMWYAWVISDDYPDATVWQRYPYEFTAPVLRVNMAMELAASVGTFVLVILWIRRASQQPRPQLPGAGAAGARSWTWLTDMTWPYQGWLTAGLAAAMVWFNPASWINAHGWPLWDIWVVPFFIWALVCITVDWWLLAGLIIGVGAMFKGQQMLVAPLFVLTAVFLGRPGAVGRWVAGLILGMALAVWPWLLTHRFDPTVLDGATEATMRDSAAPLWNGAAITWVASVTAVSLSLLLVSYILRWRWRAAAPALAAAVIGAAAFACVPLFDASTTWLDVGLLNGTTVFRTMYVAHAYNIPALLDAQFGFSNRDDLRSVLFTVAGYEVQFKTLMAVIYFVTLVLCSLGAARHWRRNDPRVLVALIAPWLLMFTILAQMHERYLLFAAVMSATLIAVRWPYLIMCVLLSFLATCMTADTMLGPGGRGHRRGWPVQDPADGDQLRILAESVQAIFPGAAWAVVACCVVMLVDALGWGGLRLPQGRQE